MNETAYRYNLAKLEEHFGGKRMISIPEMARYLQLDYHALRNDKRLDELAVTVNKQRRISIASVARWMS